MCGSHAATWVITSSSTSDGENCLALWPAIWSTAERSCSEVTASFETVLCIVLSLSTYRHTGFDDAREHAGADRQDLVVEHIAGIVHGHGAVVTDPEIGAGNRLHHVSKILAA